MHGKLSSEVEKVVSPKQILLFKEMLVDLRYDDLEVIEVLTAGVKLVGEVPNRGIWKVDHEKRARCTVESLWASAPEAQAEVMKPRPVRDEELDNEVWRCTMEEVEEGLLVGPYEVEELKSEVGPRYIASARFGLRQGGKVRPIDDFSQFSVNAGFGSEERVSMLGVDHVVAWSRAWLEAEVEEGVVEVSTSGGEVWSGRLHSSWKEGEWSDLVGMVTDLRSAYKQLAVHPSSKSFSVVAVFDPKDRKNEIIQGVITDVWRDSCCLLFLKSEQGTGSNCGGSIQLGGSRVLR